MLPLEAQPPTTFEWIHLAVTGLIGLVGILVWRYVDALKAGLDEKVASAEHAAEKAQEKAEKAIDMCVDNLKRVGQVDSLVARLDAQDKVLDRIEVGVSSKVSRGEWKAAMGSAPSSDPPIVPSPPRGRSSSQRGF